MRLQAECLPNPMDRGRCMTHSLRHGPQAPMRRSLRTRLQGSTDCGGNYAVANLAWCTGTWLIVQPIQSIAGKPVARHTPAVWAQTSSFIAISLLASTLAAASTMRGNTMRATVASHVCGSAPSARLSQQHPTRPRATPASPRSRFSQNVDDWPTRTIQTQSNPSNAGTKQLAPCSLTVEKGRDATWPQVILRYKLHIPATDRRPPTRYMRSCAVAHSDLAGNFYTGKKERNFLHRSL